LSLPARVLQSDYMHFAKRHSAAKYNLATSGVADCSLADIGVTFEDFELHGPNPYGYPALDEAIAARFNIMPEHVVTAAGASFSNHQAMAALVEPGDEVIIESPTYELMAEALGYLQANLKRVPRLMEEGFALDPERVKRHITPKTRLIVLTNLHNPSSRLDPESVIAEVAAAADKVGALVLVDEVYRELIADDGAVATSFQPDGNIIVTSSLTKAYGLSGLRCGWILAPAVFAERMRRLDDLYAARGPFLTQKLGLIALGHLEALRARALSMITPNRVAYRALLGNHPALEQVIFDHGTTIFPRLRQGGGDALLARLKAQFETSVVPGRYFGLPRHFRVGLAGDTAMTAKGLERLAEALSMPL
jgi:aspartate/methionine/tyrosine aminotransferase